MEMSVPSVLTAYETKTEKTKVVMIDTINAFTKEIDWFLKKMPAILKISGEIVRSTAVQIV